MKVWKVWKFLESNESLERLNLKAILVVLLSESSAGGRRKPLEWPAEFNSNEAGGGRRQPAMSGRV